MVAKFDECELKCGDCGLPFEVTILVGWRDGLLGKLVKEYKYHGVRAIAEVLADMLARAILQDLRKAEVDEEKIVIVPLPTIGRHVRVRGLDHTLLLARKLVRITGWKYEQILGRATDTVQVGASEAVRQEQAKKTYVALRQVEPDKIYVLLDDVWTTGASMLAAEKVMRDAGAQRTWGAVLVAGKDDET